MTQARLVILIYDVASNKRRTKLHALLKQYGVPVQESAFEARLTPSERTQLLGRIEELLVSKEDRFVMYVVPPAHEEAIAVVGQARPEVKARTYFIV